MNEEFDARRRIRRSHSRAIALVAAVLVGAALGATTAAARTTVKPSNTSLPTISGTAQEGSTLTANPGVWGGSTPITFQYQWRRCDSSGGGCSDIAGATSSTYVVVAGDINFTIRVRVTASNKNGSSAIGSNQTAKVSVATTTTTTTTTTATTTTTPATGCPSASGSAAVDVNGVTSPSRLQINQFQATPSVIPGTLSSFTLKVNVTDTCGQAVQGALVYAVAVPFGMVSAPTEALTGSDGSVTLTFNRSKGFPATTHQTLMVLYIRARKPGDNVLAGITTGRLVSIPVHLH